MSSVIKSPVAMEQAALRLHLVKQGRGRIGRENVEGRAFQPILFDPLSGAREGVPGVVIESENE